VQVKWITPPGNTHRQASSKFTRNWYTAFGRSRELVDVSGRSRKQAVFSSTQCSTTILCVRKKPLAGVLFRTQYNIPILPCEKLLTGFLGRTVKWEVASAESEFSLAICCFMCVFYGQRVCPPLGTCGPSQRLSKLGKFGRSWHNRSKSNHNVL
jgi:hypothetical protein